MLNQSNTSPVNCKVSFHLSGLQNNDSMKNNCPKKVVKPTTGKWLSNVALNDKLNGSLVK